MASSTSATMDNAQHFEASDVTYPIPVFRLASHYFLYDINHISHLRATHGIPGVLIGSLPQSPQQNVFLGLPLQLMPEEARWLVEKGIAYVVEDTKAHKAGLKSLTAFERNKWKRTLELQGVEVAKAQEAQAREKTARALSKMDERTREQAEKALQRKRGKQDKAAIDSSPNTVFDDTSTTSLSADRETSVSTSEATEEDSSLFDSSVNVPSTRSYSETPDIQLTAAVQQLTPHPITPTTSYPPLQAPPIPVAASLPAVDVSKYPVYAHLHNLSYFLSPGLRFGCNYLAYPGDPLRYHSHFLVQGRNWDEEFDLLDIVGGGRLGTGVKKGFLIGGRVEGETNSQNLEEDSTDQVRCFCIEWGGM